MEDITIKKVTSSEIIELQEIGKKTFLETFSSDNSQENMDKYLKEKFSSEKLEEELNNEKSEFYFACYQNSVIGYLKINFGDSQTELKSKKTIEIERIYILKAFHGKKIGRILYQKALDIAKEKKAEYLWLGVWGKNYRAISFYKKNGFIPFDKHIFTLGNDKQTDIMMKVKL